MSYLDITCPNCGSTYYAIRYQTSAAMLSPTIIRDGHIVSSNPNYTTYHCQCIACGAMFSATEHNDTIESIEIERGFGPATNDDNGISVDEIRHKIDENVAQWEAAVDKMNEERILTIKKKIAELQTTLQTTTLDGVKLAYGNYKPNPNPCGE